MLATKTLQTLFFLLAALIMLGATVDAEKAKPNRCIQCFAPPMCPQECPTAKDGCKIIPASCDDCGSGYCDPAPAPEAKHCIQCFAPPMCPRECPTAKEGCVIIPATCLDCGSGYCKAQ
ncbi:hypothetical protein BGX29_007023 [Mortierella sp. GBA35]|nr:hypothetical protein BGX29_007023 [Mortierella sp. GBA35]